MDYNLPQVSNLREVLVQIARRGLGLRPEGDFRSPKFLAMFSRRILRDQPDYV